MRKFLLFILLIHGICFSTQAQIQSDNNRDDFFNANDLSVPFDDEKYLALPDGVFSHAQVMNIPASSQAELLHKVLVVVDSTLYSEMNYEINRYAYDIHYVYGCNVVIEWVISETCQDIKNLIITHQNNLDGCVFIGDIIPAWYEAYDVINYNIYSRWPCDLYYMDLSDGAWYDNNSNGYFDIYQGDMEPEIFIGRISTSNMGSLIGEIDGMKFFQTV
jgi:hypothetical protein